MKTEGPNYTTIDDLLSDIHFQEWVITRGVAYQDKWIIWMKCCPERAAMVEQAKNLLQSLDFVVHLPSEEQRHAALARFEAKLVKSNVKPLNRFRILFSWKLIAAISSGFILSLFVYYTWRDNTDYLYTTSFGETKKLLLPDSSEVTLQANSELRYAKVWNNKSQRFVRLKGEALFNVSPKSIPFIVASGPIEIKVLGTVFNVKQRLYRMEVVLVSGKVQVNTLDSKEQQLLQPGELLSYDIQTHKIEHRQVNPELFTAWADGRIVLDGMSVADIFQYLQDTYGYDIQVTDSALLKRQLAGEFTIEKPEDLISMLSHLLNIKITIQQNVLMIQMQ